MARRKKVTQLPAEGSAFAVPLADGRFSVCRVIRRMTEEEAVNFGADSVLVAASTWIGDALPDPQDPALRPILQLTHHAWKGQPELLWVSDAPPTEFIPIGTIAASDDEKAMDCLASGGWQSVAFQPLAQWRWDHEREAVLAEDQQKKEREAAQRRERAQRDRQQVLSQITLDELRDRRFFAPWNKHPSAQAIRASRKIMRDAVQELLKLGTDASEAARMLVLQNCIESFNALDAKLDYFIATVEREDICEEFALLVHACGLGAHENLADEWRDW